MRSQRFTIVLTHDELDLLNRLAQHHKRNCSDLIRWLIQINGDSVGIFKRQADPQNQIFSQKMRR